MFYVRVIHLTTQPSFCELLANIIPLKQSFHVQSIAEQPVMRPFIDDVVQNRPKCRSTRVGVRPQDPRRTTVRLQGRRRSRLSKIILLEIRNPKFRRPPTGTEALYASSNPTKAWAFRFSTAASTCSSLRYVVFRYGSPSPCRKWR